MRQVPGASATVLVNGAEQFDAIFTCYSPYKRANDVIDRLPVGEVVASCAVVGAWPDLGVKRRSSYSHIDDPLIRELSQLYHDLNDAAILDSNHCRLVVVTGRVPNRLARNPGAERKFMAGSPH